MRILDTPVTDREVDFRQVWDLLTETHRPGQDGPVPKANTWSFCRFASWVVYSAPAAGASTDLDTRLRLWRTATGQLVGVAIVEGRGRDFHVITHPDFRGIEPDIYAWVEAHWPPEGGSWVTYAESGDASRSAVLASLGYHPDAASEVLYAYDLEHVASAPKMPQGFRVSEAAAYGDPDGWSRLVSVVFHPERDPDLAPERVVHLAPGYDPALDLVAVAPDGQAVAFAIGWFNPGNGIGEVEPVGTHPGFRRTGLARALVVEAFGRLRCRGARYAHIASAPEPAVSNRLYESLGPVGKQRFLRWVKPSERRQL